MATRFGRLKVLHKKRSKTTVFRRYKMERNVFLLFISNLAEVVPPAIKKKQSMIVDSKVT